MRLIETERELVRTVVARWNRQYGPGTGTRYSTSYPDRINTGRRLAALDPETATGADVAAIIGNDSWVQPRACSECGDVSYNIVMLGDEPDYDTDTVYMCRQCLVKAIALIDERAPLPEPPQ